MPQLNYGVDVTETFAVRDALSQAAGMVVALHLLFFVGYYFMPGLVPPAYLGAMTVVLSLMGGVHDFRHRGRSYGTWLALAAVIGTLSGIVTWHIEGAWFHRVLRWVLLVGYRASLGVGGAMLMVHLIRSLGGRRQSLPWLGWGMVLVGLAFSCSRLWPDLWQRVVSLSQMNSLRLYILVVAWGGVLLLTMDDSQTNLEGSPA